MRGFIGGSVATGILLLGLMELGGEAHAGSTFVCGDADEQEVWVAGSGTPASNPKVMMERQYERQTTAVSVKPT
jgi:hypothetical protein